MCVLLTPWHLVRQQLPTLLPTCGLVGSFLAVGAAHVPYRALHRPSYHLGKLLSQHQRHGERVDFHKDAGSRIDLPSRLSLQQEPLSKLGQVLPSDVKTFSQAVNQLCILTLKCSFSYIFVRVTFSKLTEQGAVGSLIQYLSFYQISEGCGVFTMH